MARSEDIKTPLARAAFTDGLFTLQVNEQGRKTWGCTLLWAKSVDLTPMHDLALKAAKEEWGDKAEQMIKDKIIKSPFLDGDGAQGKSKKTGEPHAGFPGHTFIRPVSGEDFRPKIVNKKVLPITSKDELYSGCYVYAVVNAFTWENDKNGKGISFGVSMVQMAKDGDRLGGSGGNPEEHFEKIADEGDAPASTKDGKGAGGLFG